MENKEKEKAENEQANYTSLPSDGPVRENEAKEKSDLQNTGTGKDEDANAGDLAGNASGNENADDKK